MEMYRSRLMFAIIGIVAAALLILPNFMDVSKAKLLPQTKLNYGLDIQGGLHLVMGADVDGVLREHTTRLGVALQEELKENGTVVAVKTDPAQLGRLMVEKVSDADLDKVRKRITDFHGTTLQEMAKTTTPEGNSLEYRFFEQYLNEHHSKVILQSIETIRNRIDEFGVSEPSISQQGTSRILIQLPGIADAERAKSLINTTAKLDFMILSEDIQVAQLQTWISEAEKAGNFTIESTKYSDYVNKINEALKAKIPPNTVVYFEKAANALKMENGSTPMLLKIDSGLGGDSLDDAFVSFGQYGEPQVALRFNAMGANRFAALTGENINKRMAIVLDKVVKSAPNIQIKISGGEAVITLGSGNRDQSMNEAKMIATSLRAGALPAALEQLEERRIGPTLGADSVAKARMGALVGSVIIIILICFWYGIMGVIASVCLGINVLTSIGLLASFGATLTLPGIAGIALTVGFAVDSNVLIFERIREELARSGSISLAIKEGYSRAMSAIIDSNITTAATACVLLYFGTGPVKGFAVTLLIGIATTLFANVFVSKVLVDTLTQKFGWKPQSV
jgi:preprotein translocase subunit SecD